jgi:hypothetical protein
MIRRVLVVAVTALAVLVGAVPALAQTELTYLRGGGVPLSWLDLAEPSNSTVKNFDRARNQDPGLTLETTDQGWAETSSARHQDFAMDASNLRLTGAPSLTIWTAVQDFGNAGQGGIAAHLLSCNRVMNGCNVVAETELLRPTWGSGTS